MAAVRTRRMLDQRGFLDTRPRVLHVLSVSTLSLAWSPGRIASVSVLALAVGALVVDKVFLGQTEPAAAAAAQVVPSAPAGTAGSSRSVVTLAQRLDRHRESATAPAGAAFMPPTGFFPVNVVPVASEHSGPAAASVVRLSWPRLSAVVTGASPGAILDGRLMRVGDSAGAVELIAVAERSVTVRQGEHEMVLTLDEVLR